MSTEQRYPNAWHAVVDYLRHLEVDTVFGLPSDDLRLLDALGPTAIRMILCRDQRNAAFMATGYALQSGRVGVCVVGKGPAVTNALTGLLEARSAAVPLVVLAAGTSVERRGSGAFQELEQIALVAPLVKHAHRVDAPGRVVPSVERAFLAAVCGVPGPVYLEIPDHLLHEKVVRTRPWSQPPAARTCHLGPDLSGRAVPALPPHRRPVLLVGGGMRHRNAGGLLERLAERLGAALFTTASGRGAVDESHPLYCGLSGLYARPDAAELWRTADLVVALGSRLEETATHGWEVLGPDVPVLQVNVDPMELSVEYHGPKVLADGALAVAAWLRALDEDPPSPAPGWVDAIRDYRTVIWRRRRDDLDLMRGCGHIHVAEVLAALQELVPEAHVLVQENGLQDMWSYFYPYWSCGSRGGSVLPSEQTSLGFGAAAAAGVALAARDRQVVAFVGDGAFEMVRGDLVTVTTEGIPVLYVVLRNGGYGWLQAQLNGRGPELARFRFVSEAGSTPVAAMPPGLTHVSVEAKQDLEEALRTAFAACATGRPAVVSVGVHLDDVPPGVLDLDGDLPGADAR